MNKYSVLVPFIAVFLSGCISLDSGQSSQQVFSNIFGAVLRAEGGHAINELEKLDMLDLSEESLDLGSCILSRLSNSVVLDDMEKLSFEKQVLLNYKNYWFLAMNNLDKHKSLEQDLLVALSKILNIRSPRTFEQVEKLLSARLLDRGYYSLQGRTGKLRDLMIWSSQNERAENVYLLDKTVESKVFYLNDFLSFGWSSYFACDRIGTGGWAKKDGLYVVSPKWKSLSDEKFRVSFLAHESQHFSDYNMFPNLKGWELEYRAKLIELILSKKSQSSLMQRFIGNQGNDPNDAHSYAHTRLISDLLHIMKLPDQVHLSQKKVLDINKAAIALLKLNNKQLQVRNQLSK